MPSNNEILNEAIQTAIESDTPIDLLLISKALDEINGEEIGTDKDYGMHYNYLYIGMSGQRMVDQMNSNWHATDAQFLAHNDALNIRIKSNHIKEIKVENNIVYYTTEDLPLDSKEDTRTWTSLQSYWGQITGDIANQIDLKEILDDKIGTEAFNVVVANVGANTNAIATLNMNVQSLSNILDGLNNVVNGAGGVIVRLDNIEELLAKKISSDQVVEIRTVNGTALEFTTDGTAWHPVASAGQVEWGDVVGDIENQADLQLLFKNINDAVKAISDSLNEHTEDAQNPHQVNKEQIGLGNVDNTSDMNKPVSTAQQAAIDTAVENAKEEFKKSSFVVLTKAQYEALTEKDENTVYYISDL